MLLCFFSFCNSICQIQPVRIAVSGMDHGHVEWILNSTNSKYFKLVGVSDPNRDYALKLLNKYNLDNRLYFESIEEMLDQSKPEAVCDFGSTFHHLETVEKCAPHGIHVMVEKPLAVNMEHANKMKSLATEHNIHLLTNYETTWYPSNHKIKQLSDDGEVGHIGKIVVHDGHPGPIEIGCGQEFLNWLLDPKLNGAGAVMDFGCYGANLATWLLNNQRPMTVTGILQQVKPNLYPNVDDEATIILTYPGTQVIIQASWNWPFSRKDIEVYGEKGGFFGPDRDNLMLRTEQDEKSIELDQLADYKDDPFDYFASVVRGKFDPAGSLSSLENNMIVMEILSAAIQSAKEGRTIKVSE